jgi:hypothetical protein
MNVIDNFIEVRLKNQSDFLKIKETLTRMGVAGKKDNTLYQSCHILHKRGKYYITHFKEMFILDGKDSTLTQEDVKRRNTIANLLDEWELLELVDPHKSNMEIPMNQLKIIPFHEKEDWTLVSKYTVGKK